MRSPKRLRFSPRFKSGTVFPDRVRSIKCVILSFGAFEKVKLYKTWHLVEMTIARQPDLLEGGFAPLGNAETVHCDKHNEPPDLDGLDRHIARSSW